MERERRGSGCIERVARAKSEGYTQRRKESYEVLRREGANEGRE